MSLKSIAPQWEAKDKKLRPVTGYFEDKNFQHALENLANKLYYHTDLPNGIYSAYELNNPVWQCLIGVPEYWKDSELQKQFSDYFTYDMFSSAMAPIPTRQFVTLKQPTQKVMSNQQSKSFKSADKVKLITRAYGVGKNEVGTVIQVDHDTNLHNVEVKFKKDSYWCEANDLKLASQQPTQQNAPLINEGGETVEEAAGKHLKNIAGFYHGKEADLIKEDFVSGAKWQKATTQKEVTALQTALAEANNKIAELEVQINAQKRQLKQQDKHKRMIKGLWLSMCEENKTLKDAVKDYFDSGCQVRIDSFEEFISQYVIED